MLQDIKQLFARRLFFLFLRLARFVAQHNIQLFTVKGLRNLFLALIFCKMRQKIGNAENRLVRLFTYGHLDFLAAIHYNHAMQGKRPGQPLITLEAAVIMRPGLGNAGLLRYGPLLEVQSRAVRMGGNQFDAICRIPAALDDREQGLPAQGRHYLVILPVFRKTGLCQYFCNFRYGFPLGFALAYKINVFP